MFLSEVFEDAIRGPWETAGLDVQFRIKDEGDMAEIYFQGSVSEQDWRLNFDFIMEPYNDMPVPWLAHGGFVIGYKSVRDAIMSRINTKKYVFISGYSLGAAYAQLLLEDIRFNHPEIDSGAIVYGAPRVFYLPPKVVRDRLEPLIRVNNYGDIVTHVPPAWAGYRHVGEVYKIGSFKHFLSILFPIKQWMDFPTVKSHLIADYRHNLKEANIAEQTGNRKRIGGC